MTPNPPPKWAVGKTAVIFGSMADFCIAERPDRKRVSSSETLKTNRNWVFSTPVPVFMLRLGSSWEDVVIVGLAARQQGPLLELGARFYDPVIGPALLTETHHQLPRVRDHSTRQVNQPEAHGLHPLGRPFLA